MEDLVAPVGLVVPPGEDGRAFVFEQTGEIHILRGGQRDPRPFLDLSDHIVRLDSEYDERGLLGLAFHPDFATNGRFFVYHSARAPADAPPPADHIAVVGGYVYRGSAIPALQGRYVFADFSADWTTNTPQARASLLVADPRPSEAGRWEWERLTVACDELDGRFVTGMGEGADGELYVMARRSFGPINKTGVVYRVVPPVS